MSKSDPMRVLDELTKRLDDVRQVLNRSRTRFEADVHRLRDERDRLLRRLGEQTYKLANQGKLPMPEVVKRTVDRLNDVIKNITVSQKRGTRPATRASAPSASSAPSAGGKKTAAKKKTTKKATAKTTKKSTAPAAPGAPAAAGSKKKKAAKKKTTKTPAM